MAEGIDRNTELDEEQPSTLKQDFQRYLILAGVLITLLFVYLFISMSFDEESEVIAEKEVVPDQIQDADRNSPNSAITQFNRRIDNRQQTVKPSDTKIKTTSVPLDMAPRKTVSQEEIASSQQKRRNASKPTNKIVEPLTALEKYIEAEELRSLRSIIAADTLGDPSAFYGQNVTNSRKSAGRTAQPKPLPSIEERQAAIQQQIAEITAYRKAIEAGEIDPSAKPPVITNLLGGK